MPDWKKRKRVRVMKRVLREHGAPVPKGGCVTLVVCLLAGATAGLVVVGYAFMGRV